MSNIFRKRNTQLAAARWRGQALRRLPLHRKQRRLQPHKPRRRNPLKPKPQLRCNRRMNKPQSLPWTPLRQPRRRLDHLRCAPGSVAWAEPSPPGAGTVRFRKPGGTWPARARSLDPV